MNIKKLPGGSKTYNYLKQTDTNTPTVKNTYVFLININKHSFQ